MLPEPRRMTLLQLRGLEPTDRPFLEQLKTLVDLSPTRITGVDSWGSPTYRAIIGWCDPRGQFFCDRAILEPARRGAAPRRARDGARVPPRRRTR